MEELELIPDAVDTVVCAPDDGWKYHPKHAEQFPDINKLRNVATCWIYIGILLEAHHILHISRVRVNFIFVFNLIHFFLLIWRHRPLVPRPNSLETFKDKTILYSDHRRIAKRRATQT